MRIVFISNVLTPHQVPICDEWEKMSNVEITFIESVNIDKSTLPVGWRTICSKRYLVNFSEYSINKDKYQNLILDADIVILGSAPFIFIKNRLEKGLLTFIYAERIYRNKKQLLKLPFHYFKFGKLYNKYKNLYLLSASAFSAYDYNRINCFINKAYKWGYFTTVDDSLKIQNLKLKKSNSEKISLMWCARFLKLKHPELPVKLAQILKCKGYNFVLDMYGTGIEYENIKKLINNLGLNDVVNLVGELPNDEILQAMRAHDIFLFTSDENEGWGAVTNEAMANGCTIVASSKIGSVPYLIKHKYNGCIFESENLVSLYEQVVWSINNPNKREEFAINAYRTLCDTWSPKNAANSILILAEALGQKKDTPILVGPCSKAGIIKNNWFNTNIE